MEFTSRFLALPEGSCLLLGPRGTGKSTWLAHVLPDALLLDLLKPDVYRELAARPERLTALVAATPPGSTVVVDEVQRVPELLNVVHGIIESPSPRRFVLTGSSARKLRRGGTDLLAGRAVLRSLHPFMAAELRDFDLDAALRLGMIPLVRAAVDPDDTLRAYATLYLEQEVQLEGWARNVGAFARFLEAISVSHAEILNLAHVARECQVERKTAAGYLDVLEDLLLAFRVPVFTRRASRATIAHPKFYLFDTGVLRTIRPTGPLDHGAGQVEGAALEGLVAQHLRAWLAYSRRRAEMFYWRTKGGNEVDFVVYGEAGFWAIEVKHTTRVRPEDLRALRAFTHDYPEAGATLLYRGAERLLIDGILCVPVDQFLRDLRPDMGLGRYVAPDLQVRGP
jgi:predicted AAA+ superfamily ATPase